jgi:hypothetical protein
VRTRKNKVVDDPERDQGKGGEETLKDVKELPRLSCIGKVLVVSVCFKLVLQLDVSP